jgi:hypothetical protein
MLLRNGGFFPIQFCFLYVLCGICIGHGYFSSVRHRDAFLQVFSHFHTVDQVNDQHLGIKANMNGLTKRLNKDNDAQLVTAWLKDNHTAFIGFFVFIHPFG